MEEEYKKALLIGIIGIVLLKLAELTFRTIYFTELGGLSFFMHIFIPFVVAIFSGVIISAVFNAATRNVFFYAFIPSTWYLLKEIFNKIFIGGTFTYLPGSLLDIIFIGIPIGITMYVLVNKKYSN